MPLIPETVLQGHLDRVHLCDLAHQDHGSPAATECLRVLGLLNITVIRHSQRHCPKVLAAIGHNLRKHNAAYPRGALIGAHFKGITSLQLKKEQAESIALAAQKFQADSQLLQRQRADILASLREASARLKAAVHAPKIGLSTATVSVVTSPAGKLTSVLLFLVQA